MTCKRGLSRNRLFGVQRRTAVMTARSRAKLESNIKALNKRYPGSPQRVIATLRRPGRGRQGRYVVETRTR